MRWIGVSKKFWPRGKANGASAYLVAVLDLCSRRVIGWAMSQILDAPLMIGALRMALHQRQPRRTSSSTPIGAVSLPAPLTARCSPSMAARFHES